MNLKYSLVFATLAALATIASTAGQMQTLSAQFQTPFAQNQTLSAQNQTLSAQNQTLSAQNQTVSSSGPTLFESPTTQVLIGGARSMDVLGNAVDTAKQNGYQIDSVTVYVEELPGPGDQIMLHPVYTVFMSK